MDYKMLFSPMKIGNCQIKNRIVMAPMCLGFGQFNGDATEAMINYYEERAKGGTGLIITEITRVNRRFFIRPACRIKRQKYSVNCPPCRKNT